MSPRRRYDARSPLGTYAARFDLRDDRSGAPTLEWRAPERRVQRSRQLSLGDARSEALHIPPGGIGMAENDDGYVLALTELERLRRL